MDYGLWNIETDYAKLMLHVFMVPLQLLQHVGCGPLTVSKNALPHVKSSGTSQITNGKNITKHLMENRIIIDLIMYPGDKYW